MKPDLLLVRLELSGMVPSAQIAAPAALGLAALFAGQVGGAVTMLGLAALAGLTFYLWCAIFLSLYMHASEPVHALLVRRVWNHPTTMPSLTQQTCPAGATRSSCARGCWGLRRQGCTRTRA